MFQIITDILLTFWKREKFLYRDGHIRSVSPPPIKGTVHEFFKTLH